ncbi:hypothetical protein F5146DRAFT_1142953 [Armillaria mellea]|nr:hypothetical protein F5146DRAFT_1142953 [Armillaria mellea]
MVNLAHIVTSDSSPDQPSYSNTSGDAENASKSSSLPLLLPNHSSGDEYDSDCSPLLIPLSDNKDFDPSSSDPSSSDSDNTSSILSFMPNVLCTSDMSSSDSDHPAPLIPICKHIPSTMSNIAILEHASLTIAPILQPEVYTIDVFNKFHEAFNSFFLYKKVVDDAHVLMALSALRSPAMKSWIHLISASTMDPIANWTWDHFMAQLKLKWLPENWTLQVKRLRNAAQGKHPWFEFQLAVHGANKNLLSLPGYLSNTDIQLHLEECMSDDLAEAYSKANRDHHLEQITNLDHWLDEVWVLDDGIRKEASHGKQLFKLLMAETGPLSAHAASEKKQWLLHVETSMGTTSNTPQAFSSADTKEVGHHPPRLMADERDLLMKHLRCFTC